MTGPVLDPEAIGRGVVRKVVPDEVQYFDMAAAQFRRAPRRAPISHVDDQLGFGVEIAAALTPAILWLSQVAVDAIRKQLQAEVEKEAGSWVGWAVQKLKAMVGIRPEGPDARRPPALTPAEIRHVREIVKEKAVAITQLPPEQAQRIADAIAASLIETA